ncbi:hypothetical protein PUN4_550012 [Paraburkholderia unamae]|nr:hypothetical protein PUN4_550012 [Paraburkholderia unamae]
MNSVISSRDTVSSRQRAANRSSFGVEIRSGFPKIVLEFGTSLSLQRRRLSSSVNRLMETLIVIIRFANVMPKVQYTCVWRLVGGLASKRLAIVAELAGRLSIRMQRKQAGLHP